MAKIEAGPLGEYMLAEIEVRDTKPAGDWVTEGGSDWKKEAGEEGGAAKGSVTAGAWVGFSEAGAPFPGADGSGKRTAWPICFLCFWYPKHKYILQQLPHLLFCPHKLVLEH
jgi:hypothetical protein